MKSELLMPAGSLEKLKIAILYGADAVYLGTPDMSLRTKSAFSLEEVVEGVEFAHQRNKKAYLTLNLFSHNKDIAKLEQYINTVKKVKPDGLIIADPGIFQYVKENAPELELHISTQANICSWLSVNFWADKGASLCVMARELSFVELKEIREKCPHVKLETFIHGAMCMAYSGRCMLSNYMAERGANQGNCANSCRWKYKVHMKLKDGSVEELNLTEENREMFDFFLEEENRSGELMPLIEDERGSYILNAKDLCIMPKLNEYLEIGIDSLKVEGRNKSAYYVAIVARAYRMAIDSWYKNPQNWSAEKYMKELQTVQNRGYSLAFHEGRLTNHSHNYENTSSIAEMELAGLIESVTEDAFHVLVKNKIVAGDVLEFVSPYIEKTILLRIYEFHHITNKNQNLITKEVHAGQKPIIRIPFTLFTLENIDELKKNFPPMSIIRKERELTKEEFARLKLDVVAQKLELGTATEKTYENKKQELIKFINEGEKQVSLKTPRMGVEGCCGKGCNGCLIFWHDDAYEKARELIAKKKQGEMLKKKITYVK